jgi:alpha-1,6-mannosyltransferase
MQSFTTPLCLFGILTAPWTASRRMSIVFVASFHVFILSQLGHKELRFVSYLNPLLNLFAARGAVLLCFQRSLLYRRLGQAIIAAFLAATALVTVISVIASASNYPGGEALRVLHDVVKGQNGEASSYIEVLRDSD